MSFASTVLMIKPETFGFNDETALSNSFQIKYSGIRSDIISKAQKESINLRDALLNHHINVMYMYDNDPLEKPDAVFPNNWFSTHHNGTLIIYPMLAPIRRREKNRKLIDYLKSQFRVNHVIDLSHFEQDNLFLEGTGSVVIDHQFKIAFASVSERTSVELFNKLCSMLQLQPVLLHYTDINEQAIYHTNVCLSIGNGFIITASDALKDKQQKNIVAALAHQNHYELIEISMMQMTQFCGNTLQLVNSNGTPVLAMSDTAYKAFNTKQIQQLERLTAIVSVPIPTIEKIGGGSVRCMLAEIFLSPQIQL
jgi:hypothetical protein